MAKQYLAGFSDTISDATVAGLISSIPTTTGTVDYSNVTFASTDVPDTTLTNPVWNVKVVKDSATSGTVVAQLVSSGETASAGGGTMYHCSLYNSIKTSWLKLSASTGSYVDIVVNDTSTYKTRDEIFALATSSVTMIINAKFTQPEAPELFHVVTYSVEVRKDSKTLIAYLNDGNAMYYCSKQDDAWSVWERPMTSGGGPCGTIVSITTVDEANKPALCGMSGGASNYPLLVSGSLNPFKSSALWLSSEDNDEGKFVISVAKSSSSATRELVGTVDLGDTTNGLTWSGYDVITGGGGTMHNPLRFSRTADWSCIDRKDTNHYLQINGYETSAGKGSSLVLSGADSTDATWGKGCFSLRAMNSTGTNRVLKGTPDGNLYWNGTMQFTGEEGNVINSTCKKLTVGAGTSLSNGASISFYGSDFSDRNYRNTFALRAVGGVELFGKSDGTLAWNSKHVCVFNGVLGSSVITGIRWFVTLNEASYAVKISPNLYYIMLIVNGDLYSNEQKYTDDEFKIDGHTITRWSCLAGNAKSNDDHKYYPCSAVIVSNNLYITVTPYSSEARLSGFVVVDD